MTQFVFTLTAGRTGTAYLAELFQRNLPKAIAHHEILGYDKFGYDTPDLSTFTLFNSKGNHKQVRKFWEQKLKRVANTSYDWYAETSHLLMKAGLIENLDLLKDRGTVHLVHLTRAPHEVLMSYRNRFDFHNVGNMWMWYLDPGYPRKIVDPEVFQQAGYEGLCMWYLCEIQARAAYYRILTAETDWIQFHQVDISDLNHPDSVRTFLSELGLESDDDPVIPSPKNVQENRLPWTEEMIEQLRTFADNVDFDPDTLAEQFVRSGKTLG